LVPLSVPSIPIVRDLFNRCLVQLLSDITSRLTSVLVFTSSCFNDLYVSIPHSLSVASTSCSVIPDLALQFCIRLSSLHDTLINHNTYYDESLSDDQVMTNYLLGIAPESSHTSVATIYPLYSSAVNFQDFVDIAISSLHQDMNIEAARSTGDSILKSPDGIDTVQILADTTLMLQIGILPFLKSKLDARQSYVVNSLALQLATPGTLLYHRLFLLTSGQNYWLYPQGYVPNNGYNVRPYSDKFAPHSAIAAHFAGLQRAGKYIILRESIWKAYTSRKKINFSYAFTFLAPKLTPLLRLVANPRHMVSSDKKPLLENLWGTINPPQMLDICSMMLAAHTCFPDQNIYGARRDVDAAYTRLSTTPDDCLHMIFPFWDGLVSSVAIPLTSTFGNPDSNYQFQVITDLLESRSQTRTALWSKHVTSPSTVWPRFHSRMATDDLLLIGPKHLISEEILATNSDFPLAVGIGGISLNKDLFSQVIEMVGILVNTKTWTIRISQKGFSSLLDLFWSSDPPLVGSTIDTTAMQRLAALAIRYASFFPLLLPFSRGFSACVAMHSETSSFSPRAVMDWMLWRWVVRRATFSPSMFELHYSYPLTFNQGPKESIFELSARQAALADYTFSVDACTSQSGIGVYASPYFTLAAYFPLWRYYVSFTGRLHKVHINLLKFVAVILGIIAFAIIALPKLRNS